jgi:uncharacterized protein with HEPN domain
MSAERSWTFRIDHILEAIDKIQRYTAGMTLDQFVANELVVDAVIRNFLVIGEATRNVPAEIQKAYPAMPWAQMQGMRNILVHAYEMVKVDIIWNTIQTDLPPLITPLRNILRDVAE